MQSVAGDWEKLHMTLRKALMKKKVFSRGVGGDVGRSGQSLGPRKKKCGAGPSVIGGIELGDWRKGEKSWYPRAGWLRPLTVVL